MPKVYLSCLMRDKLAVSTDSQSQSSPKVSEAYAGAGSQRGHACCFFSTDVGSLNISQRSDGEANSFVAEISVCPHSSAAVVRSYESHQFDYPTPSISGGSRYRGLLRLSVHVRLQFPALLPPQNRRRANDRLDLHRPLHRRRLRTPTVDALRVARISYYAHWALPSFWLPYHRATHGCQGRRPQVYVHGSLLFQVEA